MTAKPDAIGTFACPICTSEAPHNHISEEVEAWRWAELASDADVLSMLDELQWSRAHYRAKAAVREVARRLARAKHGDALHAEGLLGRRGAVVSHCEGRAGCRCLCVECGKSTERAASTLTPREQRLSQEYAEEKVNVVTSEPIFKCSLCDSQEQTAGAVCRSCMVATRALLTVATEALTAARAEVARVEGDRDEAWSLLDALVESLPKCDHCNRPATKAIMRGGGRWCDEHGPFDADYPRAAPLRAIEEARRKRGAT